MKLNDTSKSTISKQKERHIVTWTQQEDDVLREQINIHGTENWAIIAAKFKDKTTRQCRRRWYTYLNSDFKKGGWSPEEDMLLCEAQKIYGNRWTEIAKVVSGRTDNAVKNRFSTLCKKQAKHEALSKENKTSCINQNNKRVIFENGFIKNGTFEPAPPLKKMRTHILDITENCNLKDRLHKKSGTPENHRLRPPFAVLAQKSHNVDDLPAQEHFNGTSTTLNDGNNKDQGTFLRRDNPKITALMQQAELLTSLAVKVNTEKNNQSLDNAWKELQDFLNGNNSSELLSYKISESNFPFEDLKELLEDSRSSNMESLPCWRQPNLYESPASSGYSTGSTLHSYTAGEKTEQPQAEVYSLQQDASVGQQSIIFVENVSGGCEDGFIGSSVTSARPQPIHTEVENGGGCIDNIHTGASVLQVANIPSCDKPNENGVIQ